MNGHDRFIAVKGTTRMLKQQLRRAVGRLAPGLAQDRRTLREVGERVEKVADDLTGLTQLVTQVDLRVNHFQQFDFRLQKLRELAAKVEP